MSQRIPVTCPCGTVFEVTAAKLAAGRGKYCSRPCRAKYMKRPSGLKYNIVKDNPTSFRPGQAPWNKGLRGRHFSPDTEFRPGDHPSPDTEFKAGQTAGPKNFRWAGGPGARCLDKPGYTAIHVRVRKERGRAADYRCAFLDDTCKGEMQWANISGEYNGIEDFMPLCRSHHVRYDGRSA